MRFYPTLDLFHSSYPVFKLCQWLLNYVDTRQSKDIDLKYTLLHHFSCFITFFFPPIHLLHHLKKSFSSSAHSFHSFILIILSKLSNNSLNQIFYSRLYFIYSFFFYFFFFAFLCSITLSFSSFYLFAYFASFFLFLFFIFIILTHIKAAISAIKLNFKWNYPPRINICIYNK